MNASAAKPTPAKSVETTKNSDMQSKWVAQESGSPVLQLQVEYPLGPNTLREVPTSALIQMSLSVAAELAGRYGGQFVPADHPEFHGAVPEMHGTVGMNPGVVKQPTLLPLRKAAPAEARTVKKARGRKANVAPRGERRGKAAESLIWTCTKCGEKGHGPTMFGFRRMPDHTLRSQPQCRACRRAASKESRDKAKETREVEAAKLTAVETPQAPEPKTRQGKSRQEKTRAVKPIQVKGSAPKQRKGRRPKAEAKAPQTTTPRKKVTSVEVSPTVRRRPRKATPEI